MKDPKIVFEPQNVADWFSEIVKYPHGPGEEDPLRAELYKWLTDPKYKINLSPENVYYQAAATAPGERVIYAFRPGAAGKKPVALQVHLDMVVVTDPLVSNPFPLQPYYEDDIWVKAHAAAAGATVKSTLGADDGIGIAIALGLFQDADLKDYPIECLFTVQEETDMGGAQFFDTGLIKSRTCLNVDSEEAGTITYGSAGAFKTRYEGTIQRQAMSPAPAFVRIALSGLRGGHSGIDIANGRPSALKLLVDGLCRMNRRLSNYTLPSGAPPESFDFRLLSLARTDVIKSNSIPTAAAAVLAVPAGDALLLLKSFAQWFAALRLLYGASEPGMRIELTRLGGAPPAEQPLTASATDNLLCFLRLVPNGPIGLIPGFYPPVVETSSNLYEVVLGGTTMSAASFTRTSSAALVGAIEDHEHTAIQEMYRSLGEMYELTVTTPIEWSPAWPPNQDSHLLAVAKEAFAKVYPEPEVEVIHAGLECGWIVSRYDDMDCIAIGPTLQNGHTVDERLDRTSVKGFYDAIKGLMLSLFEEQGTAPGVPASAEAMAAR